MAYGFTRVDARAEEIAAYRKKNGHGPSSYRVECNECGTRIWGSGLGIGAHRRACKRVRP